MLCTFCRQPAIRSCTACRAPTCRKHEFHETHWRLMSPGHNAENVMETEGVVTPEGLAGPCDTCGEWTNPLEQVATASVDWFLCPSCAETMLSRQ